MCFSASKNGMESPEYANVSPAMLDVMFSFPILLLLARRQHGNTLVYLCNPKVSQVPGLAVKISMSPVKNGWSETRTA